MSIAPTGRFAPSTTGPAHLGTLLAAMVAWLAAKALGGRCFLRLEDLDPIRCRPHLAAQMEQDLAWLGLAFDGTVRQSDLGSGHAQALDVLATRGFLYACSCSRAHIAQNGRITPGAERVYANVCRRTPRLTAAQWREAPGALRVQLNEVASDPIVRRRDNSVAYLLACVVDDAAMGITEVVRGRDLEGQEPIQQALGRLLGLRIPTYRHHLLLLEPRGQKLAKLHGSAPASQLRQIAPAEVWVGALAYLAGIRPGHKAATVQSLLADFAWERVVGANRAVAIEGRQLWVDVDPSYSTSILAMQPIDWVV